MRRSYQGMPSGAARLEIDVFRNWIVEFLSVNSADRQSSMHRKKIGYARRPNIASGKTRPQLVDGLVAVAVVVDVTRAAQGYFVLRLL